MKKLILVALLTLIPVAHADPHSNQDKERLLGAIAGGYLSSTIGGGDGKTAATVIGAVLGYKVGPNVLGSEHHHDSILYSKRRLRNNQSDVYTLCEYENPYHRDSKLYWHYNRGCVQRISQQMRELERRAYEQGYQGQ